MGVAEPKENKKHEAMSPEARTAAIAEEKDVAAALRLLPLDERRTQAQEVATRLRAAYPDARCELDFTSAFELLVATVLSANTTDRRVNQVTPELFGRWPSSAELSCAPVNEVEDVVRSLGMFRRRAHSLVSLSSQLEDDHGGEVPGNRDDLVALSGVGRKTANVVLGNWFGAEEITVDTHVSRVTRRLGWVDSLSPVVIEQELWELLPDAPWTQLCHELIFHGRRICRARKPACDECVVADLCPSYAVGDQ